MSNFIGLVYATLKSKGIDYSNMTTEEAIKKFNELNGSDETSKKEESNKKQEAISKATGELPKQSTSGTRTSTYDDVVKQIRIEPNDMPYRDGTNIYEGSYTFNIGDEPVVLHKFWNLEDSDDEDASNWDWESADSWLELENEKELKDKGIYIEDNSLVINGKKYSVK